jgi:hypothetical protein
MLIFSNVVSCKFDTVISHSLFLLLGQHLSQVHLYEFPDALKPEALKRVNRLVSLLHQNPSNLHASLKFVSFGVFLFVAHLIHTKLVLRIDKLNLF